MKQEPPGHVGRFLSFHALSVAVPTIGGTTPECDRSCVRGGVIETSWARTTVRWVYSLAPASHGPPQVIGVRLGVFVGPTMSGVGGLVASASLAQTTLYA